METTQIVTQTSDSSVGGYICLFIMLALLLVFIIFLSINIKKTNKAIKKRKLEDEANGVIRRLFCRHVYGLNLPENVPCIVLLHNDRYEFEANGLEFSLSLNKVIDVCRKTDSEIQKQYVSSVGGAVAGAALFGPLGAMIGGRAKQKTTVVKATTYLIITYTDKDNNPKYVGLDVTGAVNVADRFIKHFKSIGKTTNTKIDL